MPLLDLARELLEEIGSYVWKLEEQNPWDTGYPGTVGLISSCKKLRNIMTPKLYECLYTDINPIQIMRCLAAHPDNAAHVRQLNVSRAFLGFDDCSFTNDDMALITRILKQHDIYFQLDRAVYLDPLPAADVDWNLRRRNHEARATLMATVFIALTHNARVITYSSDLAACPAFPHNSLPNLQCLSVYHWDTEYGCDLSLVEGLLHAAPNISHLHGVAINRISNLASENDAITTLSLTKSDFASNSWGKLLSAFPKLDTLSYQGGAEQVVPRDIFDALMENQPKLKYIWLSHGMLVSHNIIEQPLLGSLSFMDTLEAIHIHAGYIYPCFYERLIIIDENGNSKLKEIPEEHYLCQIPGTLVAWLPKSVRKLSISNLGGPAKDDLLQLIRVAPKQFPNLTEVRFICIDPKLVAHLDGFREQGIRCINIEDSGDLVTELAYNCPYWLQNKKDIYTKILN